MHPSRVPQSRAASTGPRVSLLTDVPVRFFGGLESPLSWGIGKDLRCGTPCRGRDWADGHMDFVPFG